MSPIPFDPLATRRWLTYAGCLSDPHTPHRGAGIGWRDEKDLCASFAYPEITGYLLALWAWLLRAPGRDPRAIEIAAAEQSASLQAIVWLEAIFDEHGAFPGTLPLEHGATARSAIDPRSCRSYLFDAGMILHGLVQQRRHAQNPRAEALALRLLTWMLPLADSEPPLGVVPLRSPLAAPTPSRWSMQSGPHLSKVAMGLANYARTFQHRAAAITAGKLLDRGAQQIDREGRSVTDLEQRTTELHPHAYAAEGLCCAGRAMEHAEARASGKRAVEWMLRELAADTPSQSVSGHKRGDVLCQALRLGTWLAAEGELSRAATGTLEKLRERVLTLHISSSYALTHAAFAFKDQPRGERHANVWVSAFALQALLSHPEPCIAAPDPLDWMDLV